MTELELATMDAKQVWLNAGDADGNAEAARFALEHGDGSQRAMQRAIEHLALAKEQAERTALLAAKTLARLQAMTANA